MGCTDAEDRWPPPQVSLRATPIPLRGQPVSWCGGSFSKPPKMGNQLCAGALGHPEPRQSSDSSSLASRVLGLRAAPQELVTQRPRLCQSTGHPCGFKAWDLPTGPRGALPFTYSGSTGLCRFQTAPAHSTCWPCSPQCSVLEWSPRTSLSLWWTSLTTPDEGRDLICPLTAVYLYTAQQCH